VEKALATYLMGRKLTKEVPNQRMMAIKKGIYLSFHIIPCIFAARKP